MLLIQCSCFSHGRKTLTNYMYYYYYYYYSYCYRCYYLLLKLVCCCCRCYCYCYCYCYYYCYKLSSVTDGYVCGPQVLPKRSRFKIPDHHVMFIDFTTDCVELRSGQPLYQQSEFIYFKEQDTFL